MPSEVLAWDENNVEHLWAAHRVTPDDIEDIFYGTTDESPHYTKRRDGDYYVFLGRTGGGRLLSLVGEYLQDGRLYVFGARDMNAREKRNFDE